jgi:3-oxoacyl-[acyl-carrier-protein] synthase II
MSSRKKVVVTGLGAICPVGLDAEQSWKSVISGCSGIAPITRFDAEGYETTFAGEVKGFDAAAVLGKKESRRLDRFSQFAVVAAKEALAHSGLAIDESNAHRVGVLIGSAMGGMETIDQGAETILTSGPRRLNPFFVPMMLANMASGTVSIALGATGPNMATVSACASSAHAIGEGAAMIRDGRADVVVAGGTEAPISRLGVAGFNAMGALSRRNDDPAGASRPFDAGRDGFVLAEGAAVLILESEEHAVRRGATALAEVAGYGSTDDAHHMVQPAPGGRGAMAAIRVAMDDACVQPGEIGYINAHGTSTQLNEKLETAAIKGALGEAATRVAISSTKSMTGHLLGAAGSLEAVFCVRVLQEGMLPPTINQTDPDPECDLDYVPNTARTAQVRYALTNSLGFGGHNVSLILAGVR